MKRVLDKPNNIGALHKLPAGRSTCKLGVQLGLLAYEAGCAGKKMKSPLGRSPCRWPLALVMEEAIHNCEIKITSRHARRSEQGHGDKVEGGPFSSQRAKPLYMENTIGALTFLEKLFLNKL